MESETEMKRPSYQSEPDFVTGKTDGAKSYSFECIDRGTTVRVNYERQTQNSWRGKTELISDIEKTELKKHYRIGLSEKSHDGGFPVFDKVTCTECWQEYITYCGVREFSNSAFIIHVQGIKNKVTFANKG